MKNELLHGSDYGKKLIKSQQLLAIKRIKVDILLYFLTPLHINYFILQMRNTNRFYDEWAISIFYYLAWIVLIWSSIILRNVFLCKDDTSSLIKVVVMMYFRYMMEIAFNLCINDTPGGVTVEISSQIFSVVNVAANLFLNTQCQFLLTISSSILCLF